LNGPFTVLCAGLLFVASHQSIAQLRRPTAPSFSFEIDAERDIVRSGAEVTVRILTTNMTDHPIGIDNGWNAYWVDVLDSRGYLMPLTEEGRRERKDFGKDRTERVSVQPGETKCTGAITVSELFLLAKPGNYTVQMSRIDPATNLTVKSNIIPLRVEPRFHGPGRTRSPLFSITISAPQTIVPSGGELKVKAELRNESSYTLNSAEGCSLEPEIFYEDGRIPVPMTERWIEMQRRPTLRRVGIQTKPGETQKCVFIISEMYQIARPGRYLIQMKRRDFWGAQIKSNQIQVTVTAWESTIQPRPTPPLKPSFSISISAQPVFQAGADVPVKVLITNVSDHAINLRRHFYNLGCSRSAAKKTDC